MFARDVVDDRTWGKVDAATGQLVPFAHSEAQRETGYDIAYFENCDGVGQVRCGCLMCNPKPCRQPTEYDH